MKQFLVACIFLSVFFLQCMASANAEDKKIIVASIGPLYLLLNKLALPSDNVVQLVKNSSSAHHYQLKVSERRLLQSADLIFWVGPELEIFLAKPLGSISRSKPQAVATLSQLQNLDWPENAHNNHRHGDHNHSRDPHIWLSPINLQVMAMAMAKRLSQLSPENSQAYEQRAKALVKKLTVVDKDLKQRLSKIADKPFVVLHPAYTHFVQRYGLRQIDYVGINPESDIGAKHLYQLGQYDLSCVFGEAGQNHQRIEKIATLSGANVAYLDPLGLHLASNAGIVTLLRKLAEDLEACLSAI